MERSARKTEPLLVGVAESSKILGISESGIRGEIKLGRLPAYRTPGKRGRVLIRLDDLRAWAEALPARAQTEGAA